MKIQDFSIKGVKGEDITLPKEFGEKVNLGLLAQAVHVYENRAHIGLRKTKTRSEVLRTSKKVYKQKGTGGARHGSRRAPIFVGGGVALGPRPVKRELTLPDIIKNKAKFMAFTLKVENKEMVALTDVAKLEKTKDAGKLITSLEKATGAKRFTFILSEKGAVAKKALKNIKNASTFSYKDINAFEIYRGGMIVMDAGIFGAKEEKKEVKKVVKKETK